MRRAFGQSGMSNCRNSFDMLLFISAALEACKLRHRGSEVDSPNDSDSGSRLLHGASVG